MHGSMDSGLGSADPVVPPLRLKRQRTRFMDVTVAIVLPWLVFFFDVSLFLFAYHDMKAIVWFLLGACMALALLFLTLGAVSRNGTFLAIGFLCFTSVVVGTAVGLWLQQEYLDRYWELDAGVEYKNVDPTADARTARNASIIRFTADTFVDDRRTIGFVADGGIFCVAPVTLPMQGDAPVQYWAVGEDCCEKRSNFDCGSARELDAATALVEQPSKVFTAAIEQAKSVYGLNTSTTDAKLVSFVSEAQVVLNDIWDETLTVALVAMITDLCVCVMSGLVLAKIMTPPAPEQLITQVG
mmetsp:Transcript_111040/g.344368  ORF Transcript_111040/g.344368 Transcript_111040/m.344368 type:complete len:298 (+) Transcript_111040:162-1055(+)